MSKSEAKEFIEIMQAYVDGKEIEYRAKNGEWFVIENPVWNFNEVEYRVRVKPKEKPKEKIPLYQALFKNGEHFLVSACLFRKEEAKAMGSNFIKLIEPPITTVEE